MIRKLLLFSLFGLLISPAVCAQQDPLYSLYLNNPIMLNPAYAGINNNFNIVAGFRKQWAGFNGSPSTSSFTAHTSFLENRMGAGVKIIDDHIGNISNLQVAVPVSYKIKLSRDQVLAFGLEAGAMSFNSNNDKLNLQDPSDPVFKGNVTQTKFTIGTGAMLKSERYLFGISFPRLLKTTYTAMGSSYTPYQSTAYLFGSYIFPVTERVQLKPSMLLKYAKGAPASLDVNFNVTIDRKYMMGLYTRNLNSYGVLAQINFDIFRIAYAFEVPTNIGMRYNTNEINLIFRWAAFTFQDRRVTNW